VRRAAYCLSRARFSLIEYFSTTFLNPSLCVRQIRAYRAPHSPSPLLIISRNYICRATMAVVTRFRHEIEKARERKIRRRLCVLYVVINFGPPVTFFFMNCDLFLDDK
jgi:hypothetical protein